MQLIEKGVSSQPDFLDGFIPISQVCDEREVFLTDEPEIRSRLAVLLGELTEVVVLGVCIQHEERRGYDGTDGYSDIPRSEERGNGAHRRDRREYDLRALDFGQPR